MRIYRLHRAHRSASDYAGALLYPGRWHSTGTPVLYFSLALSLACLERLVHLAPGEIPEDYVYTSVELTVEPPTWRRLAAMGIVGQAISGRWRLVPSVIIPVEFNLLLNPLHPSFAELVWGSPQRFAFDSRLLRS